jgi:hypothetical protein
VKKVASGPVKEFFNDNYLSLTYGNAFKGTMEKKEI